MALRDLYNDPAKFKYNSKDNKYSKDIRGGGYSGQPWQKVKPPETIDQLNSLTTEALSLDYPIRGGSYEELAARQDFARIDAFLSNYPQGKAFLDKQKGLLFSNPLMESGRSGGDVNTRVYSNGRNLMTQIAEGGTGFRHPVSGLGRELELFENTYEYIVSHKNPTQNRLINLFNIKIKKQSPGELLFSNSAAALGINTVNNGELFFYTGGPGSLYGLGTTIIQRSTNSLGVPMDTSQAPLFVGSNYRRGLFNDKIQARPSTTIDYSKLLGASKVSGLKPNETGITGADSESIETQNQQSGAGYIRATKNPSPDVTIFSSTMGYNKIREQQQRKPGNLTVEDFRNKVIDTSTVQTRDYGKLNISTRVGIGDPGARPSNQRKNTNDKWVEGQDKVNMYNIETLTSPTGIEGFSKSNGNRDIIKFVFETVNNDIPNNSNAMFFRAFLTDYSDNHSAEWQSKKYAGRGENFYTYQGFERQVSFNFKVAAQSRYEMKILYKKLNYLLSTLYPDYNSSGFMRGNFTKLTIGDLFVRTPGILTSLNLTVSNEASWEIAINGPEGGDDKDMLEVPQMIDVSVNFIPILSQLPQNGVNSPILLTAGGGNSSVASTWLNS